MTKEYWVKPTAGSNGVGTELDPFDSLRSAQSALETTFNTATEDYIVNCFAGEDIQNFAGGAWVIGAGGSTRKLSIRAMGADRHAGVRGTGYRCSSTSGLGFSKGNTNVTLEVIGIASTAWSYTGITGADAAIFDDCLGCDADGVGFYIHGGTVTARNTSIYSAAEEGILAENDANPPTVTWINGDTVACGTHGVRRNAGTMVLKNHYSGGNGTDAYMGTMTRTACAHDTATTFTGSTKSVSYSTANFLSVGGGAEDVHLTSGSILGAMGVGPSLDAAIPTVDFEGNVREGNTTAIGFNQIPIGMKAAAADVASAAAALRTEIKLGAAAADTSSSSAAVTTAIKLAAAAMASASATGALSGGALLAAAALDVATSVAALTTGIRLGGAAVDTAVSSGALTNWVAVTLSGTLYTGTGGALDPNFWVDSKPQLGTTLYYDATHITIYPNAEISSDVNSCVAAAQFFDGVSWAFGLIVCTPLMVGYANDAASATAQLSTGIQLAAAAEALATATGAFSTGAGLAAAASDTAAAGGSLSTAIPLSALAADVSAAAAALTALIKLQASAAAVATATGALNGVAALYAAAQAIAAATGNLSTGIRLAGHAADDAELSGSLTTHIKLSGVAADIASAAGALSTAIALAAGAKSSAGATADLSAFRPLVAAAVDSVTALAMLSTGIVLKANATAISHATADLTAAIALLASASGVSTASATLTDVIETPPIGVYASDPRFYIAAARWSFFGDERTAEFGRKYAAEKAVLTFDFSGVLGADEHLMGPITLMISATSGTDGDARSLFDSYPAYDMTQHKILLPVKGGLSGRAYYLQVSAATNNVHKTVTLSGLLLVRG